MLLSYKPLHLEAQQRLQGEGCIVDISAMLRAGDKQLQAPKDFLMSTMQPSPCRRYWASKCRGL